MKLRDTLEERFGRFLAIVLMVTLFISGTFFRDLGRKPQVL